MNIDKLNEFVMQFTDVGPDENQIVRIGRNYYLADKDVAALRDSIKHDAFSLGIYLGEEKNPFQPTPALIDIISKLPGSDKKKIFVNKKAEWLFLCARNILEQSIMKNPNNIREGLVLVQNEIDENLGYGVFKQEGKDLVIRNLLDKGKYLRMDEKGRRKR